MMKHFAVTYRDKAEPAEPVQWTIAAEPVPENEELLLVKLPKVHQASNASTPKLYLCLLTQKQAWGCQKLEAGFKKPKESTATTAPATVPVLATANVASSSSGRDST
jgi:hypothetical protein